MQTGKKRQGAASEYKAEVGRRTKTPGLGLGLASQGGEGERREARLREALTRANADHFKSWLMILKVNGWSPPIILLVFSSPVGG